MITVGIVDDHPAFRSGLRFMLGQMEGTQVVGEAADSAAALDLAEATGPDVMLVDLAMPRMNGIELTRRLTAAHPAIAVLVVTMFDDDDSVFSAMQAGARGYLLKGADIDELERGIRAVAAGEAIFSPGVARRITGYFASGGAGLAPSAPSSPSSPSLPSSPPVPSLPSLPAPAEPFPQLTAREREILDLVAAGLSNGQIAQRLYLSQKTIRNSVSTIFAKLQVAGRAHAIIQARDAGLGR